MYVLFLLSTLMLTHTMYDAKTICIGDIISTNENVQQLIKQWRISPKLRHVSTSNELKTFVIAPNRGDVGNN